MLHQFELVRVKSVYTFLAQKGISILTSIKWIEFVQVLALSFHTSIVNNQTKHMIYCRPRTGPMFFFYMYLPPSTSHDLWECPSPDHGLCWYQMKSKSALRPALQKKKKSILGYARQSNNGKPRCFVCIQVSHCSRYEARDNAIHLSDSLTKGVSTLATTNQIDFYRSTLRVHPH